MIVDQITNTISSLIKNSLYFVGYQRTRIQDFASSLKGNSRHFILTEWNWLIPITWTTFYAAPYMRELGMSGREIGYIGGLAIAVQAISSVMSGFFAERWGHKKTVMIFDAITWPTSYLIFAFAQDVWWIIAATILNNMFFVVMPAWSCLFIEGVKEEKRSNVYAILAIAANTAAFFMPLAGVFISMFGFMKAMRLMFFAGSLAMSAGLIYRAIMLKETEEGFRLVKEKKVYSFQIELAKFKESFLKIRKRGELLWFCIVQMLVVFALVMGNTFSTLFLTEKRGLGLAKTDITVLPFVFALVMFAIIIIFIPSIKKEITRSISLGVPCLRL